MENRHFEWENSLFQWPFSIVFCMFTRSGIPFAAPNIFGKTLCRPDVPEVLSSSPTLLKATLCSTDISPGADGMLTPNFQDLHLWLTHQT